MKKKYTIYSMIALLIFAVVAIAGINDRFSDIQLEEDNYILMPEITTAPSTPDSGFGVVSVRANNIYYKDDAGTETSMIAAAAGGVANLDEAYDGGGSGAGATIAVDVGAVTLTGTNATANTLVLSSTGSGHALALSNTGTGKDISGTSKWNVTKAGIGTFDGLTSVAGGAADDFPISMTGANDSSLVISSTGTGADALQITTTAGGIDISATGAAGEDLDISAATSSVKISAAEAIADAVAINASAGGVDISSAATFDIDITATGGKILGVASEAAADQFKIDATGAVAGNAINLETTNGGILLNADGAANGDIGINAADDVTLTSGDALTFAVTGILSIGGSAITNVLENSEVVAATNVITAAEAGKTFYLSHATEFVSTLPAVSTVSAGTVFRFVVDAAPVGDDYTVITGNTLETVIFGTVTVNGAVVGGISEDTITFADGVAIKGDWVEVRSDGTSWYVSGQGFAAGAITLTDAA